MGKNPNAKKLKERKHKERRYSHDVDDLEEEASRLGITLFELQQRMAEKESGSEDSESGEEQSTQKNKQAAKKKRQQEDSDEEEEKVPKK